MNDATTVKRIHAEIDAVVSRSESRNGAPILDAKMMLKEVLLNIPEEQLSKIWFNIQYDYSITPPDCTVAPIQFPSGQLINIQPADKTPASAQTLEALAEHFGHAWQRRLNENT